MTAIVNGAPFMLARICAAILLAGVCSLALANASAWVQTSSGQDNTDGNGPSLHTEYVVPNSIHSIRGGYREAFVKVTYAPGVELGASGDAATTEISQVMVGCSDLSWGDAQTMYFDKNMTPVLADTGEWDHTKPVWVLKNMQPLSPDSITYRTAQYICRAATPT